MKRILCVAATLLLATLACTRADVPAVDTIGSGELVSMTIAPTTPAPQVSSTSPVGISTEATVTPFEPEPLVSPTFPPTPIVLATEKVETLLYKAQPGDTLWTVAIHFGVVPGDIESPDPLPDERQLIDPGQLLLIPSRLAVMGPTTRLIPDSE